MKPHTFCQVSLVLWSLAVAVFAKEPKELVDLRKIHLEMAQRATAAGKAKQQDLLKKMADDYTKAGKLEEALLARRDLAAIWAGGMWYVSKNGKPSEWLTVYPDGFACTAGVIPGKWMPDGDGIKINWENGYVWTIASPRQPDLLTGKDSGGTNLKLTPSKPE